MYNLKENFETKCRDLKGLVQTLGTNFKCNLGALQKKVKENLEKQMFSVQRTTHRKVWQHNVYIKRTFEKPMYKWKEHLETKCTNEKSELREK